MILRFKTFCYNYTVTRYFIYVPVSGSHKKLTKKTPANFQRDTSIDLASLSYIYWYKKCENRSAAYRYCQNENRFPQCNLQ